MLSIKDSLVKVGKFPIERVKSKFIQSPDQSLSSTISNMLFLYLVAFVLIFRVLIVIPLTILHGVYFD